ncbi:MAG: PH domain-containing protein [Coriobacteriia bacterium]
MSDQPESNHPAPQAAPARQPIPSGRHHVHASYIALRTVRAIKDSAIALLALFFALTQNVRRLPPEVLPTAAAIAVPVFLLGLLTFAFVSYKRFTWELTGTELHVYRGILFKHETHIPFQRVHSIDYSAKIIERILGVVTLRVETAGGSAKAEAEIPALRLAEAEALRSEIFARKGRLAAGIAGGNAVEGATAERAGGEEYDFAGELGRFSESMRGAFAGEYDDSAPIEYEHRLTTKELIIVGISSSNVLLLVLAGFGGLTQILDLIGADDSVLFDVARNAATRVLSYGLVIAIVAVVLVLLFAWTISVIATIIRYGGFTVRRRGGRIETERGLLEHRFAGVALDRIQSVKIKQGVLRRMLGFAEISLESVASFSAAMKDSNSGTTGLVVHPLIRRSKIDEFVAALLPEFSNAPTELLPLPDRAKRRSIFRATLWPGLVYAAIATSFNLFALPYLDVPVWVAPLVAVVLLLPGVFLGYLSWKTRGYARDDDMLVLRTGVLGLETVIVPRRKIQWARSVANPFQRRLRLASISVWTAAGLGGSANAIRDVDAEVAREVLEWVEPRG